MTPARIYAAGKVRRWHANPALADTAQTNADHQGAAVQLLLALNPGASPQLIRAVVFHDLGERWVGDLPQPFKARAAWVAEAHAYFETEARREVLGADPCDGLTGDEQAWLRLVDRLEAWCHVAMTRPAELAHDGWPEAAQAVQRLAVDLGVGLAVGGLMDAMIRRDW